MIGFHTTWTWELGAYMCLMTAQNRVWILFFARTLPAALCGQYD